MFLCHRPSLWLGCISRRLGYVFLRFGLLVSGVLWACIGFVKLTRPSSDFWFLCTVEPLCCVSRCCSAMSCVLVAVFFWRVYLKGVTLGWTFSSLGLLVALFLHNVALWSVFLWLHWCCCSCPMWARLALSLFSRPFEWCFRGHCGLFCAVCSTVGCALVSGQLESLPGLVRVRVLSDFSPL